MLEGFIFVSARVADLMVIGAKPKCPLMTLSGPPICPIISDQA
jgi:hypothetical protein